MKRLNLWLLAALLCGMSMSVTSCKDDDKGSNNSSETTVEEASENANTFWGVAWNLVGTLDETVDYEDKTFEPTIGEPMEGEDGARVVILPDVAAAAAHFAAIVDADVTEATATYTYQNDAVGRLTYTKSTDGKSLATVDVDIRQIPHLQKIVYRTVDQMGTNATNDGVPYYSFGDVIKRHRSDDVDEYWVCIQAAFTPQGSKDVVWASVSQLPSENIYKYTSKKGSHDYAFPTALGNNKEYIKDLTELIYAMSKPKLWYSNIDTGADNMKAFNVVKKANVKYFNETFWNRVWNGWVDNKLANTIFGTSLTELNSKLNDATKGLKFVYYGYSWWFNASDNLSLYVSTVNVGKNKEERNARLLDWKEVKRDVITPYIAVDCVKQLQNGTQWINKNFFGNDEPHYIFRFATSKSLFGKKIGIYESLATPGGFEDVYVYTKANGIHTGENHKMSDYTIFKNVDRHDEDGGSSVKDADLKVGHYLAANGRFYETEADAKSKGGGARALVVYLGGDKHVENGQEWNGLAVSLLTLSNVQWDSNGNNKICDGMKFYEGPNAASEAFDGIASTRCLQNCKNTAHDHDLIKAALDEVLEKVDASQARMSSWFIPSYGQFRLAIEGLGGQYNAETHKFSLPEQGAPYLEVVKSLLKNGGFMTSTFENDDDEGPRLFGIRLNNGLYSMSPKNTCSVLPFIAFKYSKN